LSFGFLQLCADRRFHRLTMEKFEEVTGLGPDEYWIEAGPGGAPSWDDNTEAARLAYGDGAAHMGWAAHGDQCGGFPEASDEELENNLLEALRKRAEEFPEAHHYGLFGRGGEVEIVRGQTN
jgi:hypothetical protein